jgi:hypothetical protein
MSLISAAVIPANQAPDGVPPASFSAFGFDENGLPYVIDHAGTKTLLVLATVATKYRIKSDGSFQLWNPTQSAWHSLALSGAVGAEVLAIGAGE